MRRHPLQIIGTIVLAAMFCFSLVVIGLVRGDVIDHRRWMILSTASGIVSAIGALILGFAHMAHDTANADK